MEKKQTQLKQKKLLYPTLLFFQLPSEDFNSDTQSFTSPSFPGFDLLATFGFYDFWSTNPLFFRAAFANMLVLNFPPPLVLFKTSIFG